MAPDSIPGRGGGSVWPPAERPPCSVSRVAFPAQRRPRTRRRARTERRSAARSASRNQSAAVGVAGRRAAMGNARTWQPMAPTAAPAATPASLAIAFTAPAGAEMGCRFAETAARAAHAPRVAIPPVSRRPSLAHATKTLIARLGASASSTTNARVPAWDESGIDAFRGSLTRRSRTKRGAT